MVPVNNDSKFLIAVLFCSPETLVLKALLIKPCLASWAINKNVSEGIPSLNDWLIYPFALGSRLYLVKYGEVLFQPNCLGALNPLTSCWPTAALIDIIFGGLPYDPVNTNCTTPFESKSISSNIGTTKSSPGLRAFISNSS